MTYCEYRSGLGPQGGIAAYWRTSSPNGVAERRIAADGCFDFMVVLAGQTNRLGGRLGPTGPGGYVVGPMSQAITVAAAPATEVFGVRFAPGRWRALFGGSLAALRDQSFRADDVFGARAHLWAEQVASATSDQERIRALDAILGPLGRAADPRLLHALAVLDNAGTREVGHLPSLLGQNERAVQRLFESEVGVAPRTYRRVMRLRRALRLVDQTDLPLGQIAARAGYADQAHFTRESVTLAGESPGQRRGQRGPLSEPFKTVARPA